MEKLEARLEVLGDFSEIEKKYNDGIITFDEYQNIFSESRYHSLRGDIYPFAIGGSDAPIIRGNSKWNTPRILQKKKLRIADVEEKISPSTQRILDWGHLAEEAIARMNCKLLSEKLNKEVIFEPCSEQFRNTLFPHCVANIDGILYVGGKEKGDVYLGEVKSTRYYGNNIPSAWRDYFSKGIVPPHYIDQIYFYLGVLTLGLKSRFKGAYLLGACGFDTEKDFCQIKADINDELSKSVLSDCEDFVEITKKGLSASNANLSGVEAQSIENRILYSEEDATIPTVKLKGREPAYKKLVELNSEIKQLNSEIKEFESKMKEDTKTLKSTLREKEKEQNAILETFVPEIKNGTSGEFNFNDERYGIYIDRGFSFDSSVKRMVESEFPTVWQRIISEKPTMKISMKKL